MPVARLAETLRYLPLTERWPILDRIFRTIEQLPEERRGAWLTEFTLQIPTLQLDRRLASFDHAFAITRLVPTADDRAEQLIALGVQIDRLPTGDEQNARFQAVFEAIGHTRSARRAKRGDCCTKSRPTSRDPICAPNRLRHLP
jgi:hypothetical protein